MSPAILTPAQDVISIGAWLDRARRELSRYQQCFAHLKKGPGGHLLKNPAGHLVNGCVPPATPCSRCGSSTTPRSATATFSGCGGCCYFAGTDSGRNVYGVRTLPDQNGTFDLLQFSACAWSLVKSNTLTETFYWDSCGSGSIYGTATKSVTDSILLSWLDWDASNVQVQISRDVYTAGPVVIYEVFTGYLIVPKTANCLSSRSFTWNFTDHGCGGGTAIQMSDASSATSAVTMHA